MNEINETAKNIGKHTVKIDSNKSVTVTGIKNVESVTQKEAVLTLEKQKLTLKGSGIAVSKLDVAEGTATFETTAIASLSYTGGNTEKFSLKGMFK